MPTNEELKQLIRDAVRQSFREAGVYAETPEQAEETRLDFAFLRTMRKSRDVLGRGLGTAAMVALMGILVAAVGFFFKAKIGG